MSELKLLSDRLSDHVNDDSFYADLLEQIDSVEKPDLKFKMMLELAAFVAPKVKTVDSRAVEKVPDIHIEFYSEAPNED